MAATPNDDGDGGGCWAEDDNMAEQKVEVDNNDCDEQPPPRRQREEEHTPTSHRHPVDTTSDGTPTPTPNTNAGTGHDDEKEEVEEEDNRCIGTSEEESLEKKCEEATTKQVTDDPADASDGDGMSTAISSSSSDEGDEDATVGVDGCSGGGEEQTATAEDEEESSPPHDGGAGTEDSPPPPTSGDGTGADAGCDDEEEEAASSTELDVKSGQDHLRGERDRQDDQCVVPTDHQDQDLAEEDGKEVADDCDEEVADITGKAEHVEGEKEAESFSETSPSDPGVTTTPSKEESNDNNDDDDDGIRTANPWPPCPLPRRKNAARESPVMDGRFRSHSSGDEEGAEDGETTTKLMMENVDGVSSTNHGEDGCGIDGSTTAVPVVAGSDMAETGEVKEKEKEKGRDRDQDQGQGQGGSPRRLDGELLERLRKRRTLELAKEEGGDGEQQREAEGETPSSSPPPPSTPDDGAERARAGLRSILDRGNENCDRSHHTHDLSDGESEEEEVGAAGGRGVLHWEPCDDDDEHSIPHLLASAATMQVPPPEDDHKLSSSDERTKVVLAAEEAAGAVFDRAKDDGSKDDETPPSMAVQTTTQQRYVRREVNAFPSTDGAAGEDVVVDVDVEESSSRSRQPPPGSPRATHRYVPVSRSENETDVLVGSKQMYDFLPSDATYGRRLARYLSRYSWYYPHEKTAAGGGDGDAIEDGDDDGGDPPSRLQQLRSRPIVDVEGGGEVDEGGLETRVARPPSLDAAWAYFEHVTLARHFVRTDDDEEVGGGDGRRVPRLPRGGGDDDVGHDGAPPSPDEVGIEGELAVNTTTRSDDDEEGGVGIGDGNPSSPTASSKADGGAQEKKRNNPASRNLPPSLVDRLRRVLPRRLGGDDEDTGKARVVDHLEKAAPGERELPTRLYSLWKTPECQLSDFGVGVGLYFHTLRVLAGILFVAGLLSLPNITYFRSTMYTSDAQESVRPVLRGSAICTDQVWMACPTCTPDQYNGASPLEKARFASTSPSGNTGSAPLRFILVNTCSIGLSQGMDSWLVFLFLLLSMFALAFAQRRRAVSYDEIQQTTTDYSVEVVNPPADAIDPEEWRRFFSQFGGDEGGGARTDHHVTCCTVVLDNEILINALTRRRRLLLRLENMLPPDRVFDPDNLDGVVAAIPPVPTWKRLICAGGGDAGKIHDKIIKLDAHIRELTGRKYNCSRVFVTFETEGAQRNVLTKLSVSGRAIRRNDVSALEVPEYAFRRNRVLHVREPAEPSSIRWQDLDETWQTKFYQRTCTFCATFSAIILGAVLISACRRRSAALAGFFISILNTLVPMICTFLSNYESHDTEGQKQASLYCKVCLFRWTNTAIVMAIITPFTSTLTDGKDHLMAAIYAIFIAEIITVPLIQLSDIGGNFSRHVLGPRAPDQRRMNLHFQGSPYELSERYTNITKVLFFCFFYATIYPGAFFFAAAILIIHYFLDKYSLLRTWSQAPRIGTQVARFSQTYFFPLILFALTLMANYQWSGFPYDNACDDGSLVSAEYLVDNGKHVAYTGNGHEVTVQLDPDDVNFKSCNQNFLTYKPAAFPALPRFQPLGSEWMNQEQETVVKLFGWTVMIILAVVAYRIISRLIDTFVWPFFENTYKPSGRDAEQNFCDVTEIFAYVPQVKVPGYHHPLLACDTSNIDPELIGWTDPNRSFDYYNLIHDIPSTSPSTDDGERSDAADSAPLFSVVKEWPPEYEVKRRLKGTSTAGSKFVTEL